MDPATVEDEDIHSLVERLLVEEVGEAGARLHTGRSRNDQAATDVRLWGMDAVASLDGHVVRLAGALVDLAAGSQELVMPGYTHLQRAQPVRAAHWALSHAWPLVRDRARLRSAAQRPPCCLWARGPSGAVRSRSTARRWRVSWASTP